MDFYLKQVGINLSRDIWAHEKSFTSEKHAAVFKVIDTFNSESQFNMYNPTR